MHVYILQKFYFVTVKVIGLNITLNSSLNDITQTRDVEEGMYAVNGVLISKKEALLFILKNIAYTGRQTAQ